METQSMPPQSPAPQQPTPEFKPNIYPIMWWALAYGAIASLAFLVIMLLSRYVGFPLLFLAGLVWGAYRNYQKQKHDWHHNRGVAPPKQSFINEFRSAFGDIMNAGREMMAEQRAEDAAAEQQALAEAQAEEEAYQEELAAEQQQTEEEQPPQTPQPPQPFDSSSTSSEQATQDKPPKPPTPPQPPTV